MNLVAASLLLGLTACQTERPIAEESGFLNDYSQLQPGKYGQQKNTYVNPDAHWSNYSKAYIAPVELWLPDDSRSVLGNLSDQDKQILISFLYTSLNDGLSKDYRIVTQPGPDVLVVRTAITTAKKSRPVYKVTSGLMPMAVELSYTKRIVFPKPLSVGEAQVEMELLDGQTNERLAAAVDRRAGANQLRTKFDGSFGDVKLAFDYWADRLQTRLAEERIGIVNKTEL